MAGNADEQQENKTKTVKESLKHWNVFKPARNINEMWFIVFWRLCIAAKEMKMQWRTEKNLKGIENTGEKSQLSHNSYPTEALLALRWQVKEELGRLIALREWAVDYFSQYDK